MPENKLLDLSREIAAAVDHIEQLVYEAVKPFGFRKHGRTLHRFVDGDISQVIHFQNGCPQKGVYDVLWINLGIRIPECAQRYDGVTGEKRKYYQEYACTIPTRLGDLAAQQETYDLREDPEAIGRDVLDKLRRYVLPVFETITSREAVLENRELLLEFDHMTYRTLADLEESMIHFKRGNLLETQRLFARYYRTQKQAGANRGHIAYLENLGEKLGLSLED